MICPYCKVGTMKYVNEKDLMCDTCGKLKK